MTQEEKLLARIKSLDAGMTTLRIFKDSAGNVILWVVEDTRKAEGYEVKPLPPVVK